MTDLAYVWLNKEKDYIYCFKRESILEEEDCDMYKYNLECDEKNDFWGRTHRKGTLAGYNYRGVSDSVLNSCNFCVENNEKYEKFVLPQDARINKKSSFLESILNMLKGVI